MICQLGSSLLAASVSSGAVRQLSCDVSAQLHPVGSYETCQLSCQISCNVSAELHPVRSDDACHLSCNVLAELYSVLTWTRPLGCSVSTQLCSVSLAVICQLNIYMLAQLQSLSSLPFVAVSSICLVRVKLLAQRHNAVNVAHAPPSLQSDTCCR